MELLRQLNEQASPEATAAELIEVVRSAAPFFKERGNTNKVLYRGVGGHYGGVLITRPIAPRTNRRPSDTPNQIHTALNERMVEQFGHPFRTASLFCTAQISQARFYGDAYVLLPQGAFTYLWSPTVRDGYAYFSDESLVHFLIKHGQAALDSNEDLNETIRYAEGGVDVHYLLTELNKTVEGQSAFNRWMDGRYEAAKYTNTNLTDALEMMQEVMINGTAVLVNNRGFDRWTLMSICQQLGAVPEDLPTGTAVSDVINYISERI